MNKFILIRLLAVTIAGIALYELFPDFGLRYLKTTFFVMLHDHDRWEFLKYFPLAIFLNPILPAVELTSAYGLFKLRPWAWKLAIGTLSVGFFIRFIGAINFVIQVMQYPNKLLPSIPKDAIVVQTISMWPIYVIGLICGISIFILIQPSVKELFKENKIKQNA